MEAKTDSKFDGDRLAALEAQIAFLVERQKKQDELFAEMTPILKEVMSTATSRLDALEKKGWFAFGEESLRVAERVVEGFSPEDVRKLGDAIVGILSTVRAATQPEVLAIVDQATAVLQNADHAEPIGLVGMVRASRNDDVQKGMAVMMDVLRHVGRAAKAMADARGPNAPKALPPAPAAAPKKALGIERAAPKAAPKPTAKTSGPACAVPQPQKPVAVVLDGVGFNADGHLADPKAWTRELAERIAAAQQLTLTDAHWKLVEFARAEFEQTNVSPNVRRVTQGAGVTTKELYTLFPKAPARTLAKVAGIPKPAGCI